MLVTYTHAVAQGELRVRQRDRQPVCGAVADGDSHLPTARPVAPGLPYRGWGGGTRRDRRAIPGPYSIRVGERLQRRATAAVQVCLPSVFRGAAGGDVTC